MNTVARRLARGAGSDQLVIEPMRKRHLRDAVRIEAEAYPKGWTRGVFESELAQVGGGTRQYLVARRGRRLVGYAGLWFVPGAEGDEAHVTNVVVDADERRGGVATRLLLELATTAIGRGCAAWTLEVRASNDAAIGLYRRFGFAPAGVRKRYYENTDDAIVMWCHDIASDAYRARLRSLGRELGEAG